MSRSLLRNRYFQLLEAATAATVAADCTLAAAKLEATQARTTPRGSLKPHDGDSESSAGAGGVVSAVGVVVRRLGSAESAPGAVFGSLGRGMSAAEGSAAPNGDCATNTLA